MEMENGFDEFFEAFDGDSGEDGNQTGAAEPVDSAEEETGEEAETGVTRQEGEEASESGENESDEDAADSKEKPAEESADPDKGIPDQKFTIKVDKETREVGLAEMTELAQKGAAFDRVRGQLETERGENQRLSNELAQQSEYMGVLKLMAEQAKMDMPDLLQQLHVELLKGQGMTEAEAKAEIRAAKAEKQLKAMNEQQEKSQKQEQENTAGEDRARKEIAEFQKAFPDVKLTDQQLQAMMPDVQAGMTMTNAYLKMENTRLSEELAQQKKQTEAAEKNRKNRASSAGSQRDSGGQRTRDAFEDFFDAFEK